MKSILKEKRIKLLEGEGGSLGSSGSAVRWAQPDQDLQTHSSAPSKSSSAPRQKDLGDLQSLHECVKFLRKWKQEVERVCKPGGGALPVSSSANSAAEPRSLEQCRKLILQWADDLKKVNTLFRECEERQEKDACWESKENEAGAAVEAEQRLMEWAKELQTVSEVEPLRLYSETPSVPQDV
ncbi:hypothetical protein SRHO_G00294540 [Serrasalmus rhombeus]